jgi:hypothetical protein
MDNSPKLYFIKRDGKYYNSRDKHWYSQFYHANYEKDRKGLDIMVKMDHLLGSEVVIITELTFMEELAMATTSTVIAGEYFSNLLESFALKLPTISFVNKNLFQRCKTTIEALKPFSDMHKRFIAKEEERTFNASGDYGEFIQLMGEVKVYEMGEVINILKAYHHDKKSIMGVAKKVLNHKK